VLLILDGFYVDKPMWVGGHVCIGSFHVSLYSSWQQAWCDLGGHVVLMDFMVVHLLSSNRLILARVFLFCDIAEVMMIIHKIG
jgi:hypothetical protein